MENKKKNTSGGVSRREFLKGVGTGVVGSTLLPALTAIEPAVAAGKEVEELAGSVTVRLQINGQTHKVTVEPRTTLLTVLREKLQLTGAKPVCERGECGACTVLMDGKAVNACMVLAVDAEGHQITTVEGLAKGNELTVLQKAFAEKDGLMCGFCTPGFVMAATALLKARGPKLTLQEVKEGLAGNLCRCGTYPKIFEAVLSAAKQLQKGE